MRFDQDFIEKVRDANNIVDIISQHTQLKPSGRGFMGLCPFPDHPEKTPSFSVSDMRQFYHCFGCHKSGDVFRFLRDFQGLSFPESIEYLAERARIALPVVSTADEKAGNERTMKRKRVFEANRLALKFFRESFINLPASHPVKEYVKRRGLTEESLEKFQIGYAPESWDGLVLYLEKHAIPMAVAEEARLVKSRSQPKSGYFDIFRERLMFPIFSMMGEPVGFGGRILGQGEPKYLNSPETPVFHKSEILFGLNETARYIRSEDQAIIVEGYMDLISLYQAGVKNVVAPMGTALTVEQGRALRKITSRALTLFDGDDAGLEASERNLPHLLEADLHPKAVFLPDKLDPDEFVKERGVEALQGLLAAAPDLFELVFRRWAQGFKGEPSEKMRLSQQLKPLFASMKSRQVKSLYFTQVKNRLNVENEWLMDALDLGPVDPKKQQPQSRNLSKSKEIAEVPMVDEKEIPAITLKGARPAELTALVLALRQPHFLEKFWNASERQFLGHAGVVEALTRAWQVYRQAPERFGKLVSLLASHVDEPERLVVPPGGLHLPASDDFQQGSELEIVDREQETKMLDDALKKIRADHFAKEIERLSTEVKVNPTRENLERLVKLKQDLLGLNQEMRGSRE